MEETTTNIDGTTEAHVYDFTLGVKKSIIEQTEARARQTIIEQYQLERAGRGLEPERVDVILNNVDYEPRWMTLPEGMTIPQVRACIDYVKANGIEFEVIDWDAFAEYFHHAEEFAEARQELEIPFSVFVSWLADGNGTAFDWRHELTPEVIQAEAEKCQENYLGSGDRDDFAREYYEESGSLSGTPDEVLACVDWDEVFSYALRYDVTEVDDLDHDTHYFSNL